MRISKFNKKEMKKILLIGIAGVYNYGCEAIVRGTVEILKKKEPNSKIIYASSNYEDDKRRLEGCDVEIVRRPVRKWTLTNIAKKILSRFNIKINYCYDSVSILDGIDEVYSIGGDIYTLTVNGGYPESLPMFGDKCIKRGIKYYLWGCSVGPFTKNKEAEEFYKAHLKKVTRIYTREKESVAYLKSIGIESNVELIADPAFSVSPDVQQVEWTGKIQKIGLNLSPLSSLYCFSSLNEALESQIKTIIELLDYYDCSMVLLPHVVTPHKKDDDLAYLTDIYDRLPKEYKSRVELISNDPGFLGIKDELLKCDVVFAARMHCAVNAATAKVPIIFLSYSSKAKGMCEFVYGTTDFVMKLEDFTFDMAKAKITSLFQFIEDKKGLN